MENNKKQLVKIIQEICKEDGIKFESFSDDWIIQLTNKDRNKALIYSYKFPNNNAAISRVCDDKAALSDILKSNLIPRVEHYYIERPVMFDSNFDNKLLKLLNEYGTLVIKSNFGSGGNNIYKCCNKNELEVIVSNLLKSHRSIAISPFIDIENEYRVIIENNKAMLVYSKQRPVVIGDGQSSIKDLININNFNKLKISTDVDLDYIPNKDEIITLSWKHNLSQGAIPIMVEDTSILISLISFALKVANTLNLKFASIDIIKDKNGDYKILEINSGVMMESFSKLNENNYKIAKHIYKSAIYDYFNLPSNDNYKTIYETISEKLI